MKASLQLRQSQQLTMTPQLQQAIRLLQLSTLELGSEIQEMLVENPMLEQQENEAKDSAAPTQKEADQPTNQIEEGIETVEGQEESWDRYYDTMPTSTPRGKQPDDDQRAQEIADQQGESLHDHLYWQLNLTSLSLRDSMIAEAIIDAIDDDGYLRASIDEIRQLLANELDATPEEIETTLHRIQRFDPVGVGARNLQECLRIQLNALDGIDPTLRARAQAMIDDHLEDLARQDLKTIRQALEVDEQTLLEVISLVQSLEPKPGHPYDSTPVEYITPDVHVFKIGGRWKVSINEQLVPRLRLNQYYVDMIQQARRDDAQYMKAQLQEARWFIKSLETRNDTILRVAQCIVDHQQGFFEHGPEAMKPLVLKDVAEQLDLHESTISRVTTRKYMYTPRGVFEFKYFFSSHVNTTDGGGCSAVAIQAMIEKLISEENPQRPLSDSKLAACLNDRGIQVARRTIAKYREALGIPSSSERKKRF